MVKKKTTIIKASKDPRPGGKRPSISRWAKKAQRKNRTKLERVPWIDPDAAVGSPRSVPFVDPERA